MPPIYKMPLPLLQPRTFAADIGELLYQRDREPAWRADGHPAARYVMGWPMPAWQRPPVWTPAQNVRFIESAWLGLHLGTVVVNGVREDERGRLHPLSGLLIDGQQRLLAIEAYLNDAFAVFGHRWHDLEAHEQRRFQTTGFTRCEISVWNEADLRDLYDRLNFGGTPHAPDERAGAKPGASVPMTGKGQA